MSQIQKCPHCGKDGIFSHSICPHCGLESLPECRLEADYRLNVGVSHRPCYFGSLESELTVAQRCGSYGVLLVMGCYLFPLVCLCLGHLSGLFESGVEVSGLSLFRDLLWCVVLVWLGWSLWHGQSRIRRGLSWYGWVSGVGLLAYALHGSLCLFGGHEIVGIYWACAWLFGLLNVWCGWILHRNRNITEFLDYRRELRQAGEG